MSLGNLDDARIWARFKNGDDQSFSAIYSTYSPKLYHYGLKFTQNRTLIEDSIQELFFELLKNRRTIGQTSHILRYLMKSFRFKLFRILNHEKRYDHRNEGEDYVFDITFSIEHDMIVKDSRDQRAEAFSRALGNLTPRQKEAIYLKFTIELEYNEICEIMDLNLESCRNLIYRAIKALKEAIAADKKE
jgi:RNA polymerase sigma factor (sigma-70 family)